MSRQWLKWVSVILNYYVTSASLNRYHQICTALPPPPRTARLYWDSGIQQVPDAPVTGRICGYKVPGMILLQAYLNSYSPLRGVTFLVLPFSSYALSPTMLPLLETFLEILFWNSFQCRRHIVSGVFKYPEIFVHLRQTIFGRSQKSFRVKSWDFWVRNCLTESALWAGALSWRRIQSLGQSSGLSLRTVSRNSFNIST
jgi:hypothetical protein